MRLGTLKRNLVRVAGPLGAYRLIRAALRHSPRIFMYHRFTTGKEPRKLAIEAFEAQLRVLARDFNVMTQGALVRHIRRAGRPPPHAAVITVDDGHRDFLEHAVPALKRHGLTATLFATTRFVEGDFWLWPDRLEYALFATRVPEVTVEGLGTWSLADTEARWRAWDALTRHCVRILHDDKERLLDSVIESLAVAVPAQPVARYSAISVDELRHLASDGFEIGAHTRHHPILSRLPVAALDAEIAGSKRQLEDWLGLEVPSFCYPNGAPGDYDETVKAHVQAAGYESAVAAYFRHDVIGDLYDIKRYACDADMFQFRRHAYGVEYVSSVVRERFGI